MKMKNKITIFLLIFTMILSMTSFAKQKVENKNQETILNESDFVDENDNENYIETEKQTEEDNKSDFEEIKDNIDNYIENVNKTGNNIKNITKNEKEEITVERKTPKELAIDFLIFIKNTILENAIWLILLVILYFLHKKVKMQNPKIDKSEDN